MALKEWGSGSRQRSWLQSEQGSFIINVFTMYTGTEAGCWQTEGVGAFGSSENFNMLKKIECKVIN